MDPREEAAAIELLLLLAIAAGIELPVRLGHADEGRPRHPFFQTAIQSLFRAAVFPSRAKFFPS